MIVRILNLGQYDLHEQHLDELNTCDDAVEKAVEAGDQEQLTTALNQLIDKIRELGDELPDDSLEDSDLIIPDAEATVAEVKTWLTDSGAEDGLVPG